MGEHRTDKLGVTGSSPVAPTTKPPAMGLCLLGRTRLSDGQTEWQRSGASTHVDPKAMILMIFPVEPLLLTTESRQRPWAPAERMPCCQPRQNIGLAMPTTLAPGKTIVSAVVTEQVRDEPRRLAREGDRSLSAQGPSRRQRAPRARRSRAGGGAGMTMDPTERTDARDEFRADGLRGRPGRRSR